MRRIAVLHFLKDGRDLGRQVLELEGKQLLRHYPLTEEIAQTEWFPLSVTLVKGEIEILKN